MKRLSFTTLMALGGFLASAQSFQRIYGNGGIWSPTAFAASPDAYYLLHSNYSDDHRSELVKLDHGGDTIWARALPCFSHRVSYSEGALFITLDAADLGQPGNIVAKLDTAGNVLWANKTVYHPENYLNNYNSRIHVLPDGVLAVGTVDMGEGYADYGISLSRYNDDGALLWGRALGSPNYALNALASVLTPEGDLVVAGSRIGSFNPDFSTGLYLARFTPDGEPIWMRLFSDTIGSSGYDTPVDLIRTNDGQYAMLAEHAPEGSVVVVKVDGDGALLWGRLLHIDGYNFAKGRNLIQDGQDRFVVTGGSASTPLPNNIFLARLGPDGSFIDGTQVTDQGYAYAPLYTTTAFGQELVEQEDAGGYVVSHGYNPTPGSSWHALTTIDDNGTSGCPELSSPLEMISDPFTWTEQPWLTSPVTVMTMSGELVPLSAEPFAENVADLCELTTAVIPVPTLGSDFRAWPVPATDRIYCTWSQRQVSGAWLELVDTSGRVMLRENASGPQPFSLDVSACARGAYQLRVVTKKSTTTRTVLLR